MNETPAPIAPPTRRQRRPNATPEEKAEWAERFAASGLRQREFCRQHALGLTTLQRWLAQVKGTQSGGAGSANFVEVSLHPPVGASRWAAELDRANGTTLRLAHDIPSGLLEQLLRAC